MKMHTLSLALALTLPLASFATRAATELADAAQHRDLARLQTLLQELDVNAAQGDGSTALHWAVHWNQEEMVDQLIAAGADVSISTRLGATPLYLAALNGNAGMIDKLLKAGADANEALLSNDETPLMFAARTGDAASVRALLAAGARIDAKESYRGTTALHWAAEQNNGEVLRVLLSQGASPTLRSATTLSSAGFGGRGGASGGMTALILAAREGGMETARILLDAGAPINQQSARGDTALLAAIQNGHTDLAQLLLQRGADPSLSNDKGWTPLYLAVKARTMEVGTMPNPTFSDDAMYAIIETLLEKGAYVNARLNEETEVRNDIRSTWLEEAGATAFLRAAMGGDLPVMQLLLKHGADPRIPTHDNTTSLMALAGVGFTNGFMEDFGGADQSLRALRLLLDLGLDVNATNDDGTMALHGACHKNFVGAIQMLVDHGADLTARSYRRGTFEQSREFAGYTPLDWAQGVQTGGESALYNAEASELMERILTEHGVPIERNSHTRGGRVAAQ